MRWDRPADDAFAAHPAWSRAQSSVRERPAPGGSWSTPVFASRPIAAMFRARVRSITPAAADGSMMVVELIAAANLAAAVDRRDRARTD